MKAMTLRVTVRVAPVTELHIEINQVDETQPAKVFVHDAQSFCHAVAVVFVDAQRTRYPAGCEDVRNFSDAD